MGACQSCFGWRDKDDYDEVRSDRDPVKAPPVWCEMILIPLQTEENRLLYDDGNGMQYGSFNDPAMSGDDTIEAQREHEALQRVIAKTSKSADT
jgi:hypothetical protein